MFYSFYKACLVHCTENSIGGSVGHIESTFIQELDVPIVIDRALDWLIPSKGILDFFRSHLLPHPIRSTMKYIIVAILLVLSIPVAAQSSSQNNTIVHSFTNDHHSSPQLGRDLWFTMIKNYDDQAGKYYNLYVTSPNNTIAYVSLTGGSSKALTIQAGTVATFNIPLAWEMKTSGIVENKAIHVWSNDADISAYLMSHNPYTSDGMFIIPTIGWGLQYVVAAYNALYEGFGTYVYDFPSEMAIVANQNNTICAITPSCDLRREDTPHSCKTCVAHPKGITFYDTLQKGQSIQYYSIQAQDAEHYDVTGTIIHANKPVGVVGGSMCPNIPMGYPYCDHVCEMIPPVRTWSSTYYTAPFYPASPGKEWSTYLFIGSKANQVINRYDKTNGQRQFCMLGGQYSYYFADSINTACRWSSTDPFLLVQYVNSSTFPDGMNGQGDPAEVVINGVGQFTKNVVFQTPVSIGNQSPYTNYVNLIVSNPAIQSTTFDGRSVQNWTCYQIDNSYSIYRVPNVKPGTHTVLSDSGVGVYIYGYGYDESYAWAGALGTATFQSQDLAPPGFGSNDSALAARISLSDTTNSPDGVLNYIRLDAASNMTYSLDPNWQDGAGANKSFYNEHVIDNAKPGLLQVSVFDQAGNMTQILSKYDPQRATITAPFQDFGGVAGVRYDTLTNTGTGTYTITELRLLHGDSTTGFTLDSAVMAPLSVGEKRLIKISFHPVQEQRTFDTIVFGDGFLNQQARVTGTSASDGITDAASSHELARVTLSDDSRTAHLTLPNSWTKQLSVDIQDIRGVNVLTTSVQPNASLDLDMSPLANGVYFYRLSSGSESAAGKLVIRK